MLPFPDLFHQLFPAQVMTGEAIFGDVFFHHVLGGDTGMVHSRKPQGGASHHALIADCHILKGVVEHVADMQNAGHVGRGDQNGKGGLVGGLGRLEIAFLFPPAIPLLFYLSGFVCFVDLHAASLRPRGPNSKKSFVKVPFSEGAVGVKQKRVWVQT